MRKLFLIAALIAAPLHAQTGTQVLPQLSLDKSGNCRKLSTRDPQTGASRSLACLDGAGGVNLDGRNVSIDPRAFGAGGAGTTDDTAAFQAAIIAARASGRPISGSGVFRIDGTLDPAGVTFRGNSEAYSRNSLNPTTWGFVIEHNNTGGSLFVPSYCSMAFNGVVLYDPQQTGTAPVSRPPMIDLTSGCVDFTFQNSVVVDAYDFLHLPSGQVGGDWRVRGNRIYAIRYGIDVEGQIPETVFLSDNIWSPGIWQGVAVYANSSALAKWTGANGAVLHVDSGSVTFDGLKAANEYVFAYKNYARLDSGGLNVATVIGSNFDQVPQPLAVNGSATAIVSITGGATYAQFFGDTTTSIAAFAVDSTGPRRITITGHDVLYASGRVVEMLGNGAGSFDWQGGSVVFYGQGSAPAIIGFAIQAPSTDVVLAPALMQCSKPDQDGVLVADVRTIRIESTISDCVVAVTMQAAPTMVGGRDNSIVVRTGASQSVSNAAGSKFLATGFYDKP